MNEDIFVRVPGTRWMQSGMGMGVNRFNVKIFIAICVAFAAGILAGWGLSGRGNESRYAVLDMPRVPFLIRIDQRTGETWLHRTFKEHGVQNSYWDRFATIEDAVRVYNQNQNATNPP